jgi:hypothetical protein
MNKVKPFLCAYFVCIWGKWMFFDTHNAWVCFVPAHQLLFGFTAIGSRDLGFVVRANNTRALH